MEWVSNTSSTAISSAILPGYLITHAFILPSQAPGSARRRPGLILEELPLDVVRVAEGDHRVLAGPVAVQVGGHVRGPQGLGQPVHLLPAPADRDVIQADAEFGELVSRGRTREYRTQHQPGAGARHPQLEFLAGKVLVDTEAEEPLVEGASAAQVGHVQG